MALFKSIGPGKLLSIVLIVILISIISLYGLGIYMSKKCLDVSGCSQCWDELNITEKTNAYIDVIACACGKARYNGYADTALNLDIEKMYRIVTGSSGEAQKICDGTLPLIRIED